ncbi:hypothetical protein [Dethiosulfovibrio salsuginis]|uniref:Cell division protein ZapA n=1 Tax=Dethiosulfovibrio salsuginis TaxID=561720 RepID=A0A1X7KHU8_9BACT|nr:hypothetical protein [Dethiosulfovibrio salsuginis]SMG40600.1 hypothetical protein SAMN06275492_1289 [Dethiosulfovibrio salsuginis]
MSEKSRQETVQIGRFSYNVETSIDRETWSRLMAFTDDVISKTDSKMPSDRRLLLAWLNLVYWVDTQNGRLKDMLDSDSDDKEDDR